MPELTLSSYSDMTGLTSVRNPRTAFETVNVRPSRHPAEVTDVLIITPEPKLQAYIGNLFRRFGWSVSSLSSMAAAVDFVAHNRTAVVLSEERLPDGSWREVAEALELELCSPALIVLARDKSILSDVTALGGFDVLVAPLNESDVLWAVASAWHAWMSHYERVHSSLRGG